MEGIRKLCVLVILGMLLAVCLFAAMPAAATPQTRGFAPKRGKSGKVNIIGHGFSELGSDTITVKFGDAKSPKTEVKNDKVIKVEVPELENGIYPVMLYGIMLDGIEIELYVGEYVVNM
jgi:hypothetical protein